VLLATGGELDQGGRDFDVVHKPYDATSLGHAISSVLKKSLNREGV
jgi:hypothetical protein